MNCYKPNFEPICKVSIFYFLLKQSLYLYFIGGGSSQHLDKNPVSDYYFEILKEGDLDIVRHHNRRPYHMGKIIKMKYSID